jgi:hypothetical protein
MTAEGNSSRTPTSAKDAMAWHANALLGVYGEAVGFDEKPECGFFKTRLVKGGPWVPARIWLKQEIGDDGELLSDESYCCEIAGQRRDAWDEWPFLARNPIRESEYDYLNAMAAWATDHASDHPAATPGKPVDWRTARLPEFQPRKEVP